MTRRRGFWIGFAMVALVLVAVIGWQLYQMRDLCMTGSEGGSCPALADVGDTRYAISVAGVVNVEGALTPFGQIVRTNAPLMFRNLDVSSLRDIDPADLLVGHADEAYYGTEGPYLLLFRFGGDGESVYPTLCLYLAEVRRAAQPECND